MWTATLFITVQFTGENCYSTYKPTVGSGSNNATQILFANIPAVIKANIKHHLSSGDFIVFRKSSWRGANVQFLTVFLSDI